MSKFLKATVLGLGLLGAASAAEAMPVAATAGQVPSVTVGAPIEKTVVIVRRRVVRPRVIVRRPVVRRPLVRVLRHL